MTSFKFSVKNRLKNSKQIQGIFNNAKKIKHNNFALFIKPNDLDYPRLGIIIAKRNVKKAVTRNKVKRIIRENFRSHQNLLAGKDIIIVAYKDIDILENQELNQSLTKIWEKL